MVPGKVTLSEAGEQTPRVGPQVYLGAVSELWRRITEGVTAGWQYTSRITQCAGGEPVQWNYEDFWSQAKEGALAGCDGRHTITCGYCSPCCIKGLDLCKAKLMSSSNSSLKLRASQRGQPLAERL